MRSYKLEYRIVSRKDISGKTKEWKSTTYYLSYYEDRKRRFIDTGKTDYEEAQAIAQTLIRELEGGTVYQFLRRNNWFSDTKNPLYVESNNGTINYHYLYGNSLKNVRYLQVILEQIQDPIGEATFLDLTRDDVEMFKHRLASLTEYTDASGHLRPVTATFRNKVISTFSTIYSYYIKKGVIKSNVNPFLKVEKFKNLEETKKKFIFTPEIINVIFDREILEHIVPKSSYKTSKGAFVKVTQEHWNELINSVYIDFFKFIAYTGLRGSEAAAICINQFEPNYDFRVLDISRSLKSGMRKKLLNERSDEVALIGKTKTCENRTIVLCDEAFEIVKKYAIGKSGDDLLFTLDKRNIYSSLLLSQIRARNFNIFIGEMNEQFHFTDFGEGVLSLHGFRTSLNTNLIEQTNLRESLIANYMGWVSKSLTTTQREHYTHYSVTDWLSVANEINKLYSHKEMIWKPIVQKKSELLLESIKMRILGQASSQNAWENKVKNALLNIKQKILDGTYNDLSIKQGGSKDSLIQEFGNAINEIDEFLNGKKAIDNSTLLDLIDTEQMRDYGTEGVAFLLKQFDMDTLDELNKLVQEYNYDDHILMQYHPELFDENGKMIKKD